MQDAALFFIIGWQHIISLNALDHILFITAFSAVYVLKDWKKVLVLVTAFTAGHSVTLALSVYDVIRFNSRWVEFLIPCTIIITALSNLSFSKKSIKLNYILALVFGLIHGMGFANSIRFMLARNEKISLPLLSFNVGLEAGQIVIVTLILLVSYVVITIIKAPQKVWILMLSVSAFGLALKIAFERLTVLLLQ